MTKKQIGAPADWQKKLKNYLDAAAPAPIVTQIDPEAAALPVLRLHRAEPDRPLLLAVPDLAAAERIADELRRLAELLRLPLTVRHLPETIRGKLVVVGGEDGRARVLDQALHEPTDLLVGSVHALLAATPPPERTAAAAFTLEVGDTIPMAELLNKLVALDYDDELEVAACGEFARRGGILDLYSPAEEAPCRIEFFGDEIDSMRRFDLETQRSTGEIRRCRIIAPHPSADAEKEETASDFFAYWSDRPFRLAVLAPELCRERLEKYSGGAATDRFDAVIAERRTAGACTLLADPAGSAEFPDAPPAGCYPPLAHLAGALPDELRYGALELMRDMLLNQLRQWLDTGYRVVLTGRGDCANLSQWCAGHQLSGAPALSVEPSPLGAGLLLPTEKLVVLTERELFTVNAFARHVDTVAPPPGTPPEPLPETGENRILSELDEGDYAVHLQHGIARFRGIVEAESRGVRREVMKLEYRDGALLFVPLSQAGLVSRYLGAAGKVTLHRLGGSSWNRDKAAAGRAVRAYAADMLRLQAVRAASPGIAFAPDDPETELFEGAFPFTDTPDQRRSTGEIKCDMERPRPMDRLLCGDVGYGKTELAMRAAFKAVHSGFQVAVLAPTTVLAQQHFYTFRERFAEFPYRIAMLSRFQTASEQAAVLGHLQSGGIDIVIGTHRLCNPQVRFANLGLAVIDEEQRFGVKHKERLRQLRAEVDVLTMSATPIPRTLYLAMAGARDLSTLQTAPRQRLPVKTIVAPEDRSLIVGAIRAELECGGQIYYLHNRVRTIGDCRDRLAEALPGVRFGIAHGQLPEDELGRVMTAFLNGDIDCLVCSTIVESGLDIPNANTIIIERADRFGLAELYQLRGRVGRRNHQAYAYLLLPKSQLITGDARKRIAAIRRCSQLGAGFQLALRDLEIRGSGNLLGAEQSGHLNAIGFDLYCRLLRDEVARLSGRRPVFLPEAEVALDFVVYGHAAPPDLLPAALPPDFIDGVRPRLTAYRRLAGLTSEAELEDFRRELVDRYGPLPEPADTLLKLTQLKLLTALAGFQSLTVAEGKVLLQSPHGIYRRRGVVPTLDPRNPPKLRLALLRDILRRALEESATAAIPESHQAS